MTQPVLDIKGLELSLATPRGRLHVLGGVDLAIMPGEVVALVGESGSGKSTLAYAIMRYLPAGARVDAGGIVFQGDDIANADDRRMAAIRGRRIGMVYQDPNTALNPALRVGEQVAEVFRRHRKLDGRAAWSAAVDRLKAVALADPAGAAAKFPHQLSGGEKQRVMITMALACEPELLILDEPTTALDATTAADILDLLRRLTRDARLAVLFITHNVAEVTGFAGSIAVIYSGRIQEAGPTAEVLETPRHPYTRMLLASLPERQVRPGRLLSSFAGLRPDLYAPPPGCRFAGRCPFAAPPCSANPLPDVVQAGRRIACVRLKEVDGLPLPTVGMVETRPRDLSRRLLDVRDLRVKYGQDRILDRLPKRASKSIEVVRGVSLSLGSGETLAIVGESGCGKSTLARALVGLNASTGLMRFGGEVVDWTNSQSRDGYRRLTQIVFQHPDFSLNPRKSVGTSLGRPLALDGLSRRDIQRKVLEMLERVRLSPADADRYPHELSGGEKQRVAIARAFIRSPRLVICDEVTSGLDISVQASIINLLIELQANSGTAYLFISHDLRLVQRFADRVAVMYFGEIVETRAAATLFTPPYHPYLEALASAAPAAEPALHGRRIALEGTVPSFTRPPGGCPFHTRCPHRIAGLCETVPPPLREAREGHAIYCHLPESALAAMPPVWRRT